MAVEKLFGGDLVQWYAQRYANRNMTATVAIFRTADPDHTGPIAQAEITDVLYEGPGRVYTVSGQQSMVGGSEEEVVYATSYVTTPLFDPAGLPVMSQIADMVVIRDHLYDPLVENLVFRILDIDSAGQWIAARRHLVTGAQRTVSWTWSP